MVLVARDFDGTDDIITVSDIDLFEFTTSESYTWCAWVRHDSLTGYQCYLSKTDPAGSPSYIFRKTITSNVIEYEAGTTGGTVQNVLGVTALSANTWYFVAIVRDVGADEFRLYLAAASGNVALETSATDTTTVTHGSNSEPVSFGVQPGGHRMNGRMASVMLFTRALSLNELQAVKQGTIVPNLSGYWPLWGVASPEPDLSGNKNNGTVTGATLADHAPVVPYAPFAIDQFYSAVVTAVEDTISPTGIVSAEAVGTASPQLVVGATGVLSAEDWGEANYADERFTYADSALDYEGHAALIDVVLQVQPAGIASAEAFGTTEVVSDGVATIAPSGIASEEAFGTAAVSFVVQPTAIPSDEAIGTASVGLVVAPSGIPSDEAVGSPVLIVQIQPNSIASAEAFGTPLVGSVIAVSGIPSAEAVGAPSIQFVVVPTAIPTGEVFGTPAVSGPSTISVQGIASGEAVGTPSLAFSLVHLLVVAIPTGEAFGTAQIVGVIQPTGVASAEALGTPTVVVLGPSQPGRIALAGMYDPTTNLDGSYAPDPDLDGQYDPNVELAGKTSN